MDQLGLREAIDDLSDDVVVRDLILLLSGASAR